MTELHCIDGTWFRIEFALLPADARQERYDLLQKRNISRKHQGAWRYAAHKQQLSRKEIQQMLEKEGALEICPNCGKAKWPGVRH